MQPLNSADPRLVGRIRVLAAIGQGTMGRVLLGRGPDRRLVAVKRIHRHFAEDPEFRARFAREVAASQRVTGAYTAAITDADPDSADPWLASVFVPGPSLQEAVDAAGPIHLGGLRLLLAGLAAALAELHRAGLVHRDLKPSNVLLAADGPRVIDFGIARAHDADGQLTGTGAVLGSPAYMSPEQAEGHESTPAGDVFSVGAMVAMAATGISPFAGASTPQTLYNVVHLAPDTSRVPPALRPIVTACLNKNPADRPTFQQLLDAAAHIAAEPAWPPAVQQQIAQREAEAAHWDRLHGVGDDRPSAFRRSRRGWLGVAMAGLIGVAAGVATGAALPADVVPGTAEPMTDPAMTLGPDELRRVDECALLEESVTGDIGERNRPPRTYAGNTCSVDTGSKSTGDAMSVRLEIGRNMSILPAGAKDIGTPLAGMRILGEQSEHNLGNGGTHSYCRRTAVVPVGAQPGISVDVGSTYGYQCPTADAVLRAVVYRLAVNPPLAELAPGSIRRWNRVRC